MDILKFKTDAGREQNGIKVPFDNETTFTVASLNSRRYKEVFAAKIEELKRKTRRPSQDQLDELTMECYAEAVLVGWSGLKEGGMDVPYSKEKALEYLKASPTLREFVSATAMNHSNFADERTEEAKAELGKSSNGN